MADMKGQKLVVDGNILAHSHIDVYPFVSSPVLKTQTISIPGSDGVLDVTPNVAWEQRTLGLRGYISNADQMNSLLAYNGSSVALSVYPLWDGKAWIGRMTLKKYAMWGSLHGFYIQASVNPWLQNLAASTKTVNASAGGTAFTITSSRADIPTVTSTNSGTQLVLNYNGANITKTLPAGSTRLNGIRIGGGKSLSGVVKGSGSVTFTWRDGELWIG